MGGLRVQGVELPSVVLCEKCADMCGEKNEKKKRRFSAVSIRRMTGGQTRGLLRSLTCFRA